MSAVLAVRTLTVFVLGHRVKAKKLSAGVRPDEPERQDVSTYQCRTRRWKANAELTEYAIEHGFV
jgi:hypothetical protein